MMMMMSGEAGVVEVPIRCPPRHSRQFSTMLPHLGYCYQKELDIQRMLLARCLRGTVFRVAKDKTVTTRDLLSLGKGCA